MSDQACRRFLQARARTKLLQLYDQIREAIPHPVIAFRTKNTVTLVSQYPWKHIQIVLRLYSCVSEVLMGFDVDCCSVAYDGHRVLCTARAHNAIVSQYNTLDMSRRSPSYEMRLAKYAKRGFEVRPVQPPCLRGPCSQVHGQACQTIDCGVQVLVPNLQRELINPQVLEAPFSKTHGMARLFLLERFHHAEAQVRRPRVLIIVCFGFSHHGVACVVCVLLWTCSRCCGTRGMVGAACGV